MLPVSDFVSSDESTPESGRMDPPATEDVVDEEDLMVAVVTLLLLLLLIELLFEDVTGRTLFDPLLLS